MGLGWGISSIPYTSQLSCCGQGGPRSQRKSSGQEIQRLAAGSWADVHQGGKDEGRCARDSIATSFFLKCLSGVFFSFSSRMYSAVHVITHITDTHRSLILCRDSASTHPPNTHTHTHIPQPGRDSDSLTSHLPQERAW